MMMVGSDANYECWGGRHRSFQGAASTPFAEPGHEASDRTTFRLALIRQLRAGKSSRHDRVYVLD